MICEAKNLQPVLSYCALLSLGKRRPMAETKTSNFAVEFQTRLRESAEFYNKQKVAPAYLPGAIRRLALRRTASTVQHHRIAFLL